jgi:hypothetical protein
MIAATKGCIHNEFVSLGWQGIFSPMAPLSVAQASIHESSRIISTSLNGQVALISFELKVENDTLSKVIRILPESNTSIDRSRG